MCSLSFDVERCDYGYKKQIITRKKSKNSYNTVTKKIYIISQSIKKVLVSQGTAEWLLRLNEIIWKCVADTHI